MTEQTKALIAAEHLVGNLWYNLDALPLIAARVEPTTVRLVVGGSAAMAYSEMCRLMRSPSEPLSAGALEANLHQQGFDFSWLAKLQSRLTVEGVDALYGYAGEVNNAADLYRIRMYCAEADKQAAQADAKADVVTAGLLGKLAEANRTATDVEHASTVMGRVRERLKDIRAGKFRWGASTGFDSLDRNVQLVNGELITIAGMPSQGKTSLWRQIFYHRAKKIAEDGDNGQVVMFSSDDTAEKTMLGLACTLGKVNSHRIRYNQADSWEWEEVEWWMTHIESLPIFIDSTSHPTVDGMYYRCAMLNAQKPIRLGGQDYLTLIKATGKEPYDKVRESAEGVKSIGRTLNFPWLQLSQLSKKVEDRRDKWPTPSDLQYAGEAESNVCMLIMRPEHYIARGEDIDCELEYRDGVALINVGKNKDGDTGIIPMKFTKEFSRFDDLKTPA